MTRARAKELLPVIEGYANGEVVQVRMSSISCDWRVTTDPEWRDSIEYRIKPKLLEVWVVWCDANAELLHGGRVYVTCEEAEKVAKSDFAGCGGRHRVVKMREIDEVAG